MPNPYEWRHSQRRHVNGALYWISYRQLHGNQQQNMAEDQAQADQRPPAESSSQSDLAESQEALLAIAEESPLAINTHADSMAESEPAPDAWTQALADGILQAPQPAPERLPLQFVKEEGLPPAHAELWWP